MRAVNELLYHFGVRVSRNKGVIRLPREFMSDYRSNLTELQKNPRGFQVFKELLYDAGTHPESYIDVECTFATQQIATLNPQSILDVGSYRLFTLGLLAHFDVTTVDVRGRLPISKKESVLTCDAKKLLLSNDSFDLVLSLSTLEHFGLGRYGDEFDADADRKAFREMVRVIKPGGALIFTSTITQSQPSIAFNAHRIYSHAMLEEFCGDLTRVDERFYSNELHRACSFEEVTKKPQCWDVYCGCWKKL